MKFLLISPYGEGAGALKRIADEGNEVALWIKNPIYRDGYSGILPKVEDWSKALTDDTVILFDMTGLGELADELRKEGYAVFGGSKLADRLEHDRDFGLEVMRQCGIEVPETKSFTSFDDARAFLKGKKKERYVFKPSGDDIPSKMTYVAKDTEDLLGFFAFVEPRFNIEKFDLQLFIEGAEVSSEFWSDGQHILKPYNHTVEAKKYANDNLGPAVGCSGNIIWFAEERDRIISKGLELAEEWALSQGFIGQLDLNAIVNEQGVYGLEWTPRFGYDSLPTMLPMIDGDMGELFSDCARGQGTTMPYHQPFGVGVRVSIPPYPAEPDADPEELEPSRGVPVWIEEPENCYLYEVENEDGQLVHAGGTGLILTAVAAGNSPRFRDVYRTIRGVKVPNAHYRTDLEDVLLRMYWAGVDQA